MKLDSLNKRESILEYRNYMSEKYIRFLSDSFNIGWEKQYQKINKKISIEDELVLKLTLIHPFHLKDLIPDINKRKIKQLQIQGKRIFDTKVFKKCESEKFWGYQCPFPNDNLVADHAFPYSLGGPTKGVNLRCLCKWHNMVKSNDIHCYPWEDLVKCYTNNKEHWINNQIDVFVQKCNISTH